MVDKSGALAALLGAVGLLGWALSVEVLRRMAPGLPAMHPVTAILILMGAAALFAASRTRLLAGGLAIAVILAAKARLTLGPQFGVGEQGGILDRLFATSALDRMAFGTASSLCLLMTALLAALLLPPRFKWVSQGIAVVATAIPFTAFIGLLFEISPLFVWRGQSAMSLLTVIALMSLGFGIFCAGGNNVLTEFLRHQTPVARLARRLLAAGVALQITIAVMRQLAQDLGLIDRELAVAIQAVASVTVTLGLLSYALVKLLAADRLREKNDAELEMARISVLHLSRDSAMATMASALAHELNQPLTAISNYAAVLAMSPLETEENEELVPMIEQLQQNALRAGEIMRRMRAIAERGAVEEKCSIDLSLVIDETVRLLTVECSDIDVRVELSHQPDVVGDPVQIQQILLNLLRNACEAVRDREDKWVRIRTFDQDDNTVVSVTDSGPGIDPAVLPHLFEPMPSTKEGGMGVGLSVSRTIADAHGGRIYAQNSERGGACFCFTLPH